MAQTIWDEPTAEQSALLSGILTARGDDGSWPTLPQLTDRLKQDIQTALDSFPAAKTTSGKHYRAVWQADDEIGLTLTAGLLTVDYEIAPYLAMLRTCANRVASAGPVTMTSTRFHRQFGDDHAFHVRTFPAVLRREPLGAAADIQADGDDWRITFREELAAYKGVRHLKDYVEKTVVKAEEPRTHTEYVDPTLLTALAETEHPARDRLLALLRELNTNYAAGNPYATLLLHRAVTTGNTEVVDMADLPPAGSLDALVQALIDRG
jgi:hypothetical protein